MSYSCERCDYESDEQSDFVYASGWVCKPCAKKTGDYDETVDIISQIIMTGDHEGKDYIEIAQEITKQFDCKLKLGAK